MMTRDGISDEGARGTVEGARAAILDGIAATSRLVVSAAQLEEVRADAKRCYPDECCGILYGTMREAVDTGGAQRVGLLRKEVLEIEAIHNAFDEAERYHRFEITAQQMMCAELRARQMGMDIVGFYHSHPDCEAIPSEYDRTHALPVYSYLIVSCMAGEVAGERDWVIDVETKRFIEEEVIWQSQC